MKIRGIKLARKAFSDRPKRFSITWLLPNFLPHLGNTSVYTLRTLKKDG